MKDCGKDPGAPRNARDDSGNDAIDTRRHTAMTLRGVMDEAWRNITTGTTHMALFTIILAVLIIAGIAVEGSSLARIETQRRQFVAAGGSTYAIEYDGHVSGAACDGLNGADGILAAGAVRRSASNITMAKLPSTYVPTWDATPGAIRLLASSGSDTAAQLDADAYQGVWMSDQAAKATGSATGADEPVRDGGSAHVSGIYAFPDDGRDTSMFGYAALQAVSTDSDTFDMCLVKTWPVPDDIRSLLLYTATGATNDSDESPRITQLNSTLGEQYDATGAFEQRSSAPAPYAIAIAAAIAGFVSVTRRRLELASALHCGVPKLAMLVQMLAEAASWILCAVAISLPVCAWERLAWNDLDLPAVDDALLRMPVAGAVGALAGVLLGALLVREKLMFKYFKER